MFCPNCRAALPDESRFCSSCGKSVPAAPVAATRASDVTPGVPQPGSVPRTEWPAGVAQPSASELDPPSRVGVWLAALLSVLLAGGAFWLLGRSRGAPGSVAAVPTAPVARGPSVVRSPASPRSPVATPPRGMPEEIRRYLSFLQGVEAQRKQYEAQLTNQMLAAVPNLLMPNFDENSQPPDQQMVRQFDQMAQQYAQATIRFQAAARQVSVPPACQKLHMYYSTALSLNPRLTQETARRLAAGDYAGLLAMRRDVGKTIEENYRAADDELARTCQQYEVRKTFDIGNSGGGNSILLP